MAYKLLVSGESGSGKTSLTKGLKNSLVISHDGKIYPYPNPHAIIEKFSDANELIDFVETKALAYKERFGSLPETIVFDSVSRIFETFSNACNTKYTGFTIYSELNKRIAAFAEFLEQLVDNGINVIIISHAIYDADTSKYLLVGSGSFSKMGGFYSVVDEAVFLETKNNKRIIHFRSTKYPARTLNEALPDSIELEKFDLYDHLHALAAAAETAQEFRL